MVNSGIWYRVVLRNFDLKNLRLGCAAILALGISGCTIPTPVSIATYAVDGVSYAVSGKSMSDHAISAVLEQDCAMFRVMQGKLVCRKEGDTSDERLYDALAAVYGEQSPLNTPYPVVAIDSVESVGEFDGVTIVRDRGFYLEQLSREERLAAAAGLQRAVIADNQRPPSLSFPDFKPAF